ncbi:MAG: DNA-3-methyladenine glycosylase 2 family protein [Nitrospinae bacterium]|nr:DNA-3-methyladenine glycosylase 2 family protein [Nitrospinota bacterium]MDA1110043.1 DNA-3-methyladenine glycosylase 2 family protein [Nitrospinota bacterium]
MAELIREIGPFQLKKNRKYFQVLCKAIISQQISTKAAHSITVRFYGLFDGQSPTPQSVFAMPEPNLRSVGLSRQKAAYLKDLSRHFVEKSIRPHRLPHLSNEDVILSLTGVHGIGRWTAEMFLIFSLNRMDVLPVADLGLQNAVKILYGMKSQPTLKKIRSLGKKWNPLETVATWYAWRKLDENIVAY